MSDPKDRLTWVLSGLLVVAVLSSMAVRTAVPKDSAVGRCYHSCDASQLPKNERELAEFLLLMPMATTIICFSRVVIGISTFGTFTPALLALAFRDIHTWKALMISVVVFSTIWIIGCSFRRSIHSLNLLQVPRSSLVLTTIVIMLLIFIFLCNMLEIHAREYLPLLPLVILTGMLERYWILETEEGSATSIKTLLSTLVMAIGIRFILDIRLLKQWLLEYPETLGLAISAQLLLGRYTGYRLLELYRFRILTDR